VIKKNKENHLAMPNARSTSIFKVTMNLNKQGTEQNFSMRHSTITTRKERHMSSRSKVKVTELGWGVGVGLD
jgi:hypothetical protein